MIPTVPDPRVTSGEEIPCLTTRPDNPNRFLLKRMSARAPGGRLMLQDLGEMEGSDHWGNHYVRVSQDAGQTWLAPRPLAPAFQNERGLWMRMGESTFLAEPDFLSRIYNLHEYPDSGFRSDIWWNNRIVLQEWNSSAGDFGAPRPLEWDISPEALAGFWTYGRNALALSFSRPLVTRSGRIIFPVQWIPEIPEYKHPVLRWRAGCLIGRRTSEGLRWWPGGFVDLSLQQSTRGVFEPAIAETSDGRLIMIARASNTKAPQLPSHKWLAQSHDGGETWDMPTPLTWSDGTLIPSPSSGNALIRSASGDLWWLGNIAPHGTDGNRPRHPLLLVRVREDATPSLDPDSIVVIDCRHSSDSEFLQLSNFKVHVDQKTREFVITYARLESLGAGVRGAGSVERRILP